MSRPDVQFVVAPWMFGEGPPDDPFPCDCGTIECQRADHNGPVQDWFRRMETRYADKSAPNAWDDVLPPGGHVCAACGEPTESEPCPDHQQVPE